MFLNIFFVADGTDLRGWFLKNNYSTITRFYCL